MKDAVVAKSTMLVRLPVNQDRITTVATAKTPIDSQYTMPSILGNSASPPAMTRTDRAMARGKPSATVSAVENIVVTAAASTSGRAHEPNAVV